MRFQLATLARLVGQATAAGAGQQEPWTAQALGPEGAPLQAECWEVAPGSGRSWPGARVWGDKGGLEGGAGLPGAGPGRSQPRGCQPQPGSVAAAAENMEPPDARAGARGAPRLLVLALLLGAHPGMARTGSRARLGAAPGDRGKGRRRGFHQHQEVTLGTPRRRVLGAWGYPFQ